MSRFIRQSTQRSDIEVIDEGSDGEQAIAFVNDPLPDVVLLDLLMPKMDGMTVVREIKRFAPNTHIVILTSYYEDDQIFKPSKQVLFLTC
jgi:NarL family two-component system response regulator LiaR